jgi:hypothetical protein
VLLERRRRLTPVRPLLPTTLSLSVEAPPSGFSTKLPGCTREESEGKVQESQRRLKRKIFNLTNSSASNISGKGEMIAQFRKKFHIIGKRLKDFKF